MLVGWSRKSLENPRPGIQMYVFCKVPLNDMKLILIDHSVLCQRYELAVAPIQKQVKLGGRDAFVHWRQRHWTCRGAGVKSKENSTQVRKGISHFPRPCHRGSNCRVTTHGRAAWPHELGEGDIDRMIDKPVVDHAAQKTGWRIFAWQAAGLQADRSGCMSRPPY